MYERFYSLREPPFALSPDPDYLFPSRGHTEALSYLRYGIEGRAGFIVITGEIGCGKTTLLQTVLRGLDRQASVSRLVNTTLDARDLIEAVMLDFNLDPGHGRSKPHLLRELSRYLVDQRLAGRLVLLVIDEAQNLSQSALEEVRMLSNLETEKSKLLQIVLVGQPNLRQMLARVELEQFRQRVTVNYHLRPLAAEETFAYINHRLRRASIGAPLEFSRDVTDLIHLHSRGVARRINVIADAVLLHGYGEERRIIDVDLTHQAIEELGDVAAIEEPAPTRVPAPVAAAPEPSPAPWTAGAYLPQIAAREALVAEREQRLAEQQRALFDEYRRLHDTRTAAPPMDLPLRVAPTPPPPPTPPAAPTPPAVPVSVARPPVAAARRAPMGFATHRVLCDQGKADGVWKRMKRGLFGVSKPAFEK